MLYLYDLGFFCGTKDISPLETLALLFMEMNAFRVCEGGGESPLPTKLYKKNN